ncbi:unnamed protein product [Protopolystoma xenopodis]|uniref:Uncharacterized protein n=1 Tax=Protopolystoma xenopodis TaxID=117903 RepID=A0A3S5C5M0_9PLAT|nr:unnamed protein product [Protopolystoma xenopodis]
MSFCVSVGAHIRSTSSRHRFLRLDRALCPLLLSSPSLLYFSRHPRLSGDSTVRLLVPRRSVDRSLWLIDKSCRLVDMHHLSRMSSRAPRFGHGFEGACASLTTSCVCMCVCVCV